LNSITTIFALLLEKIHSHKNREAILTRRHTTKIQNHHSKIQIKNENQKFSKYSSKVLRIMRKRELRAQNNYY